MNVTSAVPGQKDTKPIAVYISSEGVQRFAGYQGLNMPPPEQSKAARPNVWQYMNHPGAQANAVEHYVQSKPARPNVWQYMNQPAAQENAVEHYVQSKPAGPNVWQYMNQPAAQENAVEQHLQHQDAQSTAVENYVQSIVKHMQQLAAQPNAAEQNVQYPDVPMQQLTNYTQSAEQYVQYPATHMQPPAPGSNYQGTPDTKWQPPVWNVHQPAAQSNHIPNYQAIPDTSVPPPKWNVQQPVTQPNHQPNYTPTPENMLQSSTWNAWQPATLSNLSLSYKPKVQLFALKVNHQKAQSNHTPALQSSVPSQDSSATVTSTSGGAEIAPTLKGAIEVRSTNAARLVSADPEILFDASPDHWHKVIVVTTGAERVGVIKAINKRISPMKLIPYFFHMEDRHITFLVNKCSAPLAALCRRDLKVPYLFMEIELKLLLHAKKVDISAIFEKIISNRLSSEKTFLDLSKLINIPEFQQMMYDPSDTSYIQQRLLKTAEGMDLNIVRLSLAGNELSTLIHLNGIFADRSNWKSLKILDLTDNEIRSISELMPFHSLPLIEVDLHRNPVCQMYKEAHSYISVIRVNFPHLTKLDGVYLQRTPGIPQWRPNYIFYGTHGDSAELADQFVEHYFTLYDGGDRTLLRGLYHENAYFSVSSMYLYGQSTSHGARLSAYIAEGRNLLRSTDKWKTKSALCRGEKKILAKLAKLPLTQHDPYSFNVDLLHLSDTGAILTVTGMFKEQNPKLDISVRHFTRTFVLLRLPADEYQIVNDIMYVTNAATAQVKEAFLYMGPFTELKKPPKWLKESEKNSMIETYSQLTEMKHEWSCKCLDTAGWDLKEALQIFIAMYKADKIPVEGFINPKEAAKL